MHRSLWFSLFIIIALWEVAGRFQLVASGALPAPSAIISRFWEDRADYPPHVLATLQASFLGFMIGNAIAIFAGTVFCSVAAHFAPLPGCEYRDLRFAAHRHSPILVLTLSGMTPRIVLAALGCYFATMTATVIGLTQADARSIDVVRAYGGSGWSELRFIRLRGALPSILGGFRIAAPAAVLGAILAEFGGGGRYGLGSYLLGSLGRADPPRLWGIGLTATLIAGLAYGVFAFMGNRLTGALARCNRSDRRRNNTLQAFQPLRANTSRDSFGFPAPGPLVAFAVGSSCTGNDRQESAKLGQLFLLLA